MSMGIYDKSLKERTGTRSNNLEDCMGKVILIGKYTLLIY